MIGKGMFIWLGSHIGASNAEVVSRCVELGLDWVAVKIGNGSSLAYASFVDMERAAKLLHDAGIKVWGWHYVTGGNGYSSLGPRQDAEFAIAQSDRLGLDGYLIDAEGDYKTGDNPPARAQLYADTLQPLAARIPVGLCSYRFPSYHPEFPWKEMLSVATLHVPQLYYGPGRMLGDLNRSFNELQALKALPFVPDGRNYVGDGYGGPAAGQEAAWIQQFVQEILDFMAVCKARKFPGFTFWALDFCFLPTHAGGRERFEAIKSFTWEADLAEQVAQLKGEVDALGKAMAELKDDLRRDENAQLAIAGKVVDVLAALKENLPKNAWPIAGGGG